MTISNAQPWYGWRWTAILSSLAILLLGEGSLAQVTTTITPDRTLGTEVTQNGKVQEITGGARPEAGPNLFHSFHRFNVGTGDTAHFIGQPGIDHIIGRVTGPEASRIDGTVQADASLFLLNPQGILFGPSATLNINGSFHATTADVLRFGDGAEFSTRLSEKSTLTVASPSAFGFLHANPAGIAIEGSHLEVPEGKTLSLISGKMTIAGDGDPASGPPNLSAPAGRINLASVASSGNVAFDPASQLSGLDVGSVDQVELGHIDVIAGALIDVSGEGSGAVVIRGGRLMMDHSWLFANTLGKRDGVEIGVDIEVDEFVLINEGWVTTDVRGEATGNAGNLSVVARNLRVDGGSQLNSSTSGPGHGGLVTIRATEVTLEGRTTDNRFPSGVFADAQGDVEGAGDAGGIVVEAQQVRLAEGAVISSSTDGPGKGGTVTVKATELALGTSYILADARGEVDGAGDAGAIVIEAQHLRLTGGAAIASNTFGPGKGGTVNVWATEVNMEGATTDNRFLSGIFANARGEVDGAGDAGDIVVEAQQVRLTGGAQIVSATFGPGKGGTVTVHATEVDMEGATTDNRFLSGIFANTEGKAEGAGDAGDIVVEAQQVRLAGGAQIASSTFGPGKGGAVNVRATEVDMEGATTGTRFASGLFASAEGEEKGSGDAGDIVVEAQQVRLAEGAVISSSTDGPGKGGTVTVKAMELALGTSYILADARGEVDGAGDAGAIVIEAQRVRLSGGAAIASNTFGPGKGGTVNVRATEVNMEGATTDNRFLSGIFANARGEVDGAGDAGDIVVEAQQVRLTGGAQIVSATFGPGKGGTVTVHATEVDMEGATTDNRFLSGIFANTEGKAEGAEEAGDIVVEAQQVRLTGGAQIASATFGPGKGGTVTVHATEVAMEGATPDNRFASGLFASAQGEAEGAGDAGTILVEADQLTLSGGAQIFSATFGPGSGGTVTVHATEMSLEGATPDNSIPSGLFATAQGEGEGAGDAGTILIEADQLTLSGGARLNSTTFGPGSGGAVTVRAKEITLDGATSDNFFPSGILAGALGEGDAGTILIDAGHLALSGGARISSTTFGPGNGGAVTVRATTITLEGATPDNSFLSGLFANAQGEGEDSGDAGTLVVEAQDVNLSGGAQIASATSGPGNGGNITLHGSQLLLTEGASISSRSSGEGNAGTIQVEVSDLTMRDHSLITTEATRAGGGDIEIEAQIMSLLDSDITATVETGEARGGNIRIGGTINTDGDIIESLDSLSLEESHITANTDAGDGANITIGARQVVLDSNSAIAANTNAGVGGNLAIAGTVAADRQALSRAGTIILRESEITANAQAGQGGRIEVVAEVFLADPDSVVDASSQVGIDGEVNIEAVVTNLSEVVMPLSQRLASEAPLLRDRCATRLHQGLVSSFVERERVGIPSSPEGLLPSRLDVSDAEVAWSGESRSHGIAIASEPSWRLSSGCP